MQFELPSCILIIWLDHEYIGWREKKARSQVVEKPIPISQGREGEGRGVGSQVPQLP